MPANTGNTRAVGSTLTVTYFHNWFNRRRAPRCRTLLVRTTRLLLCPSLLASLSLMRVWGRACSARPGCCCATRPCADTTGCCGGCVSTACGCGCQWRFVRGCVCPGLCTRPAWSGGVRSCALARATSFVGRLGCVCTRHIHTHARSSTLTCNTRVKRFQKQSARLLRSIASYLAWAARWLA